MGGGLLFYGHGSRDEGRVSDADRDSRIRLQYQHGRCTARSTSIVWEKMMHPSGLTLERWNWPFKTDEERATIQAWLEGVPKDLSDKSIPF